MGQEITVTSQNQLDSIPTNYDGTIIIDFGTLKNKAVVTKNYVGGFVRAVNRSVVNVYNTAQVGAIDMSIVCCYDSARVNAANRAQVWAWDKSNVFVTETAKVVAHDNSTVVAENSTEIKAFNNVKVSASEGAEVWAHDNTEILLKYEAFAYLYDNSKIINYGGTVKEDSRGLEFLENKEPQKGSNKIKVVVRSSASKTRKRV